MRVIVKKWGNRAAVRIPAAAMKAAHINLGDVVDVREMDGSIVIEPIRPQQYDLDQLVGGITADNLHKSVDFARPIGSEVL